MRTLIPVKIGLTCTKTLISINTSTPIIGLPRENVAPLDGTMHRRDHDSRRQQSAGNDFQHRATELDELVIRIEHSPQRRGAIAPMHRFVRAHILIVARPSVDEGRVIVIYSEHNRKAAKTRHREIHPRHSPEAPARL